MNIYQRINKVMKDVGYVQRETAGQGTGVKYDEVASKIREAMITHGIVATISQNKSAKVVREESTQDVINKDGSTYTKNIQRIYGAMFEVKLINMDEPKDFHIYTVEAHAMDSGDKATGKLNTYAMKVVLVKAFLLETGINDESREEVKDRIQGNTVASAQEYADMMKVYNEAKDKLPEKRFDNASKFFEERGITKQMIESGAISKANAQAIIKSLTTALSKC